MNHLVMRSIIGTIIVFILIMLVVLNSVSEKACVWMLFIISCISMFAWFVVGVAYTIDGPEAFKKIR